jgi:light-regulated signal transduction histidine kinase (bacteriophytochrome)
MDYARELEKKAEWEKVIDELAHSLNTNLGATRDSINSIILEASDPNIIQHSSDAEHYLRESAELVDLTLDSLKVDINQDNLSKILLSDIIESQLNIIKKGLNTLRFSTHKHLENVKKMNIPISFDSSIKIETYSTAANLIIKDLIKNAFLNTDSENPQVTITTKRIDPDTCLLIITNNKAISKEWADWINFDTEQEEIRMSKSRRVGMRVVKRWKPKLKWQIFVSYDQNDNLTTTTVTIPLLWK